MVVSQPVSWELAVVHLLDARRELARGLVLLHEGGEVAVGTQEGPAKKWSLDGCRNLSILESKGAINQ